MKNNGKFIIHSYALIGVFCLSATALNQPSGLKKGGVWAVFTAVLLTAILSAAEVYIVKATKNKIKTAPNGILARVILTAFLLPLILTTVVSFFELLGYVSLEILPQASKWIIAALLTITVIFVARGSDEAVFKLVFILGLVCAVAVSLILLLGLEYIKITPLISGDFEWKGYLKYTLSLTGKLSVPVFSALVFINFANGRASVKRIGLCTLLSGAAAVTAILQSAFCFGAEQTDALKFPYTQAVGIISTGSLFSRLDGIAYAVVFFSYIIKISVSIKAIGQTVKLLVNKKD